MTSPKATPSSQTVLVTGANRGIGLGLAKHYLHAGDTVIACCRSPNNAAELKALQPEAGDRLLTLQLDVAKEQSIHELSDQLRERDSKLDLAINNAGIAIEESFADWTAGGFQAQFQTNAIGPALIAQSMVPLMTFGSRLINISSGMGSIGWNLSPAGPLDGYAASKAAMNMIARRLATPLRAKGITVIALDPGWVQTEMGGADATTPVAQAVQQMTQTFQELSLEHTGKFLHADGKELPW